MSHATAGRRARGYEDLPGLLSLMTGDEKHEPSAHSTLDVLWVLYDRILRIDPQRPDDPRRDRFFLSKGHGPAAYYAILAAKGFIDVDELRAFGQYESRLGFHPDGVLIPGVEMGSGSLGHGLGIAVGSALGLRIRALASSDGNGAPTPEFAPGPPSGTGGPRVFCLLGDGEMDEGSNHEAIAYAGRTALGSLTAVVVDNHSARHGWPGGIEARFEVEGWSATRVDGRDHDALEAALSGGVRDRPDVVVADVGGAS